MLEDSKPFLGLRPAAILTNSYVAGAFVIESYLRNQLVLLVNFTIGSLTSGNIKIEYSYDGTNFFQETNELLSGAITSESAAQHDFTATGTYVIERKIMYPFIKVSAKGTGTVTSSSMSIDALVGTV